MGRRRRADSGAKNTDRPRSRTPAADYRSKTAYELSSVSRDLERSGHPAPLGDPLSGVMLVVDPPVGPRLISALTNSLDAVDLADAYVTWTGAGTLPSELLVADPTLLVALGPQTASEIDELADPLVITPFSDAAEGVAFGWKRSVVGLLLPPLAPALDNEDAKKEFWRAFLTLKRLSPGSP